MLENVLTDLSELLSVHKRPELVNKLKYGQYSAEPMELLYNDGQKRYESFKSYPENKTVGSAEAFSACIKEELKRRENMTGNKATVRVYTKGGYFVPDENFGVFKVEYDRINSQQWNYIKTHINKVMTHRLFLEFV